MHLRRGWRGEGYQNKNFKQYVDMYLSAAAVEGNSGGVAHETVVSENDGSHWEIAFAVPEGYFRKSHLPTPSQRPKAERTLR